MVTEYREVHVSVFFLTDKVDKPAHAPNRETLPLMLFCNDSISPALYYTQAMYTGLGILTTGNLLVARSFSTNCCSYINSS